jgi:hypothetical protein
MLLSGTKIGLSLRLSTMVTNLGQCNELWRTPNFLCLCWYTVDPSLVTLVGHNQKMPKNWESMKIFFTYLLYTICRICYKCVCSISTGSWMSYAQWRNSHTHFSFVHLGITLILVLGIFSGLSGRISTAYLFTLCVVSLLSSRFTASALVWFSNCVKYWVFHFFISLSTVFVRSSWILWLLIQIW